MARSWRGWAGALAGILGVLACEHNDGPSLPRVGDTISDQNGVGTVTSVRARSSSCYQVTIQYAAPWSCTAEQLQEPSAGASRMSPEGTTVVGSATTGEDVSLRTTDCDGLAALRRPALKASLLSQLDARRLALLYAQCVGKVETRYYDGAGTRVTYCSSDDSDDDDDDATGSVVMTGAGANNASTSEQAAGATEYSTTNTQVVGVDEADFVKNDAGYIYLLSAQGLHVIDAWPAPEMRQIARVSLPGEPRRLFLVGERLVVFSRMADLAATGGAPSSQGCTYGYDCRFSSEGGHTLVVVYDVAVPAQPTELARYEFSGAYADSRRVGSTVYTVVHDSATSQVPGLDLTLDPANAVELELEYQALTEQTSQAVDALPSAYFLPWIRQENPAGEVLTLPPACDGALAAAAAAGTSFLSLVAFDLSVLGPPTRTLVATKPGFVYGSPNALYVAVDGVDGRDDSWAHSPASTDRSSLHKFVLDGVRTRYAGSASIRGHVLNQFSMDEKDGVLRVATSSGWVPDPAVSSSITTLSERDGRLMRLGELTGLAAQEDIRAVRFAGDQAFVVTFKKTDPLFVIDLATPTAPRVLGELKIPGFSTYLHPMDPSHLLAVGFDADDQGSFAYFDGIQVQIFDVTDLGNPLLMHRATIGTRGSASEALLNHLAFNYFPAKGVLALPMTICEGGGDGQFGDQMTFSGLMVFDISLQQGVAEHGRMPFVDPATVTLSTGTTCSGWWSGSTSLVKRSIFMDDYAYGISDAEVRVAALSGLGRVLAMVSTAQ